MTFKEKLKQEHPEKVNPDAVGGCYGCPSDFGYEDNNGCKRDCGDEKCTKCWNREMPNTYSSMTAEEAWDIAKKLFAGFSDTELNEIFGKGWSYPKLMELSPYEAKAKLDEWKNKQIRVGDVVHTTSGVDAVVLKVNEETVHLLFPDGSCGKHPKGIYTKTGKHIDIQSVLDQIGGDSDV